MTAPLSLSRMQAMLRRLSPSWPSTAPDTSVGKELDSIAVPLGMAADIVDTTLDESFPDTADRLLARWEAVTRVSNKGDQDIDARRARVLAVLRRTSGPRLDQLEAMLAAPLDTDIGNLIWIEQTRFFIENALTVVDTTTRAINATPTLVNLGQPWPGVVDTTGVRVYLKFSALGTPVVHLNGPDGTLFILSVTSTEGWYETRATFLGKPAAGAWTLSLSNGSAVNLLEARLLVSNDVDSAQIYNFFVYRDPALPGSPDIAEAQRLFARTALGHFNAHVIERLSFIVGDPHSLCGREPLGV